MNNTHIVIYNSNGTLIIDAPICEGSKRRFSLMAEDSITICFAHTSKLVIPIGSYCNFNSQKWVITDNQEPKYDENTGGYKYELKFSAEYWGLKNKIFKFIYTDSQSVRQKRETSWTVTGSLYLNASTKGAIGQALEDALQDIDNNYSVVIDNMDTLKEARSLTFQSCSLIDAFTMIAEAYSVEWWVIGKAVYFGKKSGTTKNLTYGVNLKSLSTQESTDDFMSRLYAFGATRNIPASYSGQSATTTGVSERRLKLPASLPSGVTLAHHLNTTLGCLDLNNTLSNDEAVEKVVLFDDIYPKHIGTIGNIEYYEVTDSDNVAHRYYRFRDTSADSIVFSTSMLLPKETLQVTFTSGALNGLTFDCKFNPKGITTSGTEDQLYEIVANNDYGIELPSSGMTISNGDHFVLTGWDSSQINQLVANAEKELLLAADAYLSKVSPINYNCTLFALSDASQQPDFADTVNITYPSIGSVTSRVIGFTKCLDIDNDECEINCGEVSSYSRIGALESQVSAITNIPNMETQALAKTCIVQCDTASNESVKTCLAHADTEESITSQRYLIRMTNGNTAQAVTLKIGVSPAYPLIYRGSQASSINTWGAGEVLDVAYDNGVWRNVDRFSDNVRNTGSHNLPIYFNGDVATPIDALSVSGNIASTAGGVSAKGLCDLSIHTGGGGGGGGTTDYRDLENKPKINGTTLSGNVSLATLGIAPASHNHSGTYEPVINSSHKISADNVDDRTSTNKFVTASEKSGFHTHSNKAILDGIAAMPYVKPANGIPDNDLQEAHYTESEVDALLSDKVDKVSGMGLSENDYSDTEKQKVTDAYSARHSHSNKELLDSYTQTEANITDAVSKKHSHSNKNLLDTYNQTNANLADAVTKRHSHSNKGLIDTYTQTENNLADAVSKKHSHDNKSLLDGYTHENAELSTAITMASSAIQGVKIDNSDLTKDADNKVNIPNAGASSTGLITATAQTIGGDKTFNGNVQSHGGVSADGMCDLTISGSGGGGTTDYADLSNKPKINGNELSGNKTSSILGLADSVHTHTAAQVTGLAEVATSGSYNDLSNKPTIPAAQIQSDWEQTNASAKDYIKNKPAIPVVNDGKLTIKQNGSKKGEFTANDTDNVTIELTDTIYDDTELTGRVTSVETTIGGYGNIVTHEASEFATAAQGVKADTAVQPAAISDMETKTHAGNTYAPISTTYTKNDVNGLLSNKADTSALTSHTSDTNNPHSVTKEQVGLSNVDNTSDLNKPISTATQTALDGKASKNGSSSEDFAVKNLTASGGVSADGMCDLTVQGAGGGGVSDFNDLSNRPKYNGNPMTGSTSIPLVNADYWNAKADTSAIPTKTSDLTNDGDGTNAFLTQHQSLSAYSTTSQMNAAISNHHDSSKADASALTSHTGNTDIHVTQSDKSNWNGKQSAITASNKLPSDLVDDTNHTNKFVSQDEKDAWSAKLDKVTGATAGHVATLTSDGTLQDGTYTIAKSVPSDAVFTDTTYGAGRGISLSSSGNFGHSNESITPVGEHGLKLLKVRVDAYGHITNYDAGIDDKIITIAGQDIAPRGSITAETIGNALTSSAPAAYATTAKDYDTSTGGIKDAIDGINDSLNDKLEGITANGEATTITSHIANIPAADATHSGVVSKSAQVFAGNKTFNGSINGQSGISAKGMCDLSVLESGGGVVFGEWQTLVSGVQYRKLGTMVVFRGACNVQDLTSYDINYFVPIGTLASGFRPNADITIEQTLILYMGLIEAEQRGSKTIGNAELKITTTGAIGFRLFQWMYDTRFDMWGRLDFNGMIIFTD